MKPMGTFRNNAKASILSKQIAFFHNRGFASASKIQTVLNLLRTEAEIKHLKNLDQQTAQEIAREIAERVQNGEIQANTGADYISALNQISDYTNHFFDADIQSIQYSDFFSKTVDYADRAVSETTHQDFQSFLAEQAEQTQDERYQALQYAIELEREFGLRFRESAGLNQDTIEKALETGVLELSREDWTKNAREREIPVRTEEQRELLTDVSDFLREHESVNLAGAKDWKDYAPISDFRAFADEIRQEFQEQTGEQYHFHGERHFWAQDRYTEEWKERTGVEIQSPIQYYAERLEEKGWNGEGKFYDAVSGYGIQSWLEYAREETGLSARELKELDQEIRQEISEELGHSRTDITNAYLGHP